MKTPSVDLFYEYYFDASATDTDENRDRSVVFDLREVVFWRRKELKLNYGMDDIPVALMMIGKTQWGKAREVRMP